MTFHHIFIQILHSLAMALKLSHAITNLPLVDQHTWKYLIMNHRLNTQAELTNTNHCSYSHTGLPTSSAYHPWVTSKWS